MFAGRRLIPSRAYCAAIVVPSLCRLNTSIPATNRRKSSNSSGLSSGLSPRPRNPGTGTRCRVSTARTAHAGRYGVEDHRSPRRFAWSVAAEDAPAFWSACSPLPLWLPLYQSPSVSNSSYTFTSSTLNR
jgi:hypothetical protein